MRTRTLNAHPLPTLNPPSYSRSGLTPLMLACVYKHASCVRVLMQLGANCLQLDSLGRGAIVS